MVAVIDKAVQAGAARIKDKKKGQGNLFDDMIAAEPDAKAGVSLPDIPEYPEKEKLGFEKEVLGFYLSAHPLESYRGPLQTFCSHTSVGLKNTKHRDEVMLGGMISSIKLAHTRNPKPGAPSKYANFDLEDLDGAIRCIMWPDDFEKMGHFVQAERVVILRGSVDKRNGGDECNLIVNEVIRLRKRSSSLRLDFRSFWMKHDMAPMLSRSSARFCEGILASEVLLMRSSSAVVKSCT